MARKDPKLTYSLLSKSDYYATLTHDINATNKDGRVFVMTMTVIPTLPEVERLVAALIDAVGRGVEVHFSYDAYNYLVSSQNKSFGPLFYRKAMPKKTRGIYQQLQLMHTRLTGAGVVVHISNQPTSRFGNPFAGRSHIKTAVVNNVCYIGGCNLTSQDDTDIMMRIESLRASDWIYATLVQALESPTVRDGLFNTDRSFSISSAGSILLDAGVKRQSLIYDSALDFIDSANEWLVMTCQFFPNSTTAAHLLAAHNRGVNVKILYNHPAKHLGVQHKILQTMVRKRETLRMPNSFFDYQLAPETPFLHAKIIASERGAIVGSHNYVRAGVQFGTAEIALLLRSPQFGSAVAEFIQEQLKS